MYFDQRLLLPESSFLDRFTDAAWEEVRGTLRLKKLTRGTRT